MLTPYSRNRLHPLAFFLFLLFSFCFDFFSISFFFSVEFQASCLSSVVVNGTSVSLDSSFVKKIGKLFV